MTELATIDAYAAYTEPSTLRIQRLLPGPVERVWDYIVDSDKRRQWLASGEMEMKVGAPFEFVWRNDELTDPPGRRPEGASGEHRLESQITELDPPHRIGFTWGSTGGVTIELQQQGDEVLLTLTHRRAPDRSVLLSISAGWHAHLDLLADRLSGGRPAPFWDDIVRLKAEYENRVPV